MARPKREIDAEQFENLCAIQCTKEEIALFFDCSEDTIERWCKRTYKEHFAVVFGKKRGKGKISLRRSQFELAKKNPTMAIWLGKQWLGQRDTPPDVQLDKQTIRDALSESLAELSREMDAESGKGAGDIP